ncbi:MAG: hypothetical protein LAN59_15860 [Acidobacteriia bacterium]|nr:hypothetical protein [Terriglobia bacterium]
MKASIFRLAAPAIFLALLFAEGISAQQEQQSDPAAALAAALTAACRANETQFANYLTADNAAAFRALSADRRAAFLRRFSLADDPGNPLLSSDAQHHTVVRCTAPGGTSEFRLGAARTRENLAFIPVSVAGGAQAEFGLVLERGEWRLLSLGLMLLDIPQLSRQWAEEELTARENSAIAAVRELAEAIETYRRVYGKLPDSLAQLGPAPKNEISPEQASLVDEHLAGGNDGVYQFRYRIVPAAQEDTLAFELVAMPDAYGKTARRSFFLDATGQLHGADKGGAAATADDPAIP